MQPVTRMLDPFYSAGLFQHRQPVASGNAVAGAFSPGRPICPVSLFEPGRSGRGEDSFTPRALPRCTGVLMLVKKIIRYIERERLLRRGDRVLVAVSGGPDSLCLLHLLCTLKAPYGLSLIVAHLDHRIRPESRQEAEKVRRIAGSWGLPFEGAAVDLPAYRVVRKLSSQEASRIVRYRFPLEAGKRYGAGKIALGHHRDDLAETVLFNLLRGTGPDGLAGILPRRSLGPVELIRPLLGITREEIERYCREYELEPILDSSNLETVYTRNRIRLELIPHLEKNYNPRLKRSLADLAVLAAADRAYFDQVVQNRYERTVRRKRGKLLLDCAALAALPAALRGRVAYRALSEYIPAKQIGRRQVEQLLSLAEGQGPARQIFLPAGIRARRSYGCLILSPAAPAEKRSPAPRSLQVPGRTAVPGEMLAVQASLCRPGELSWPPASRQAYLDYDSLPGPLQLRTRWPGARFYPQGAPGSKKLKDFMIDQKVPLHLRERLPLVAAGCKVIWVAGKRIAHPYRVTDRTRLVLVLELQHLNKAEEEKR